MTTMKNEKLREVLRHAPRIRRDDLDRLLLVEPVVDHRASRLGDLAERLDRQHVAGLDLLLREEERESVLVGVILGQPHLHGLFRL